MHRHRRNPRRRPAGRRTNPRAWRHHKAPNHSNLQGGEETRARGKRGSGADLGVDLEGRVARRLLRVVRRRREARHLVARRRELARSLFVWGFAAPQNDGYTRRGETMTPRQPTPRPRSGLPPPCVWVSRQARGRRPLSRPNISVE